MTSTPLQEAADATQGLSSRTVQASPPSAKPFLSQPCVWASEGVAGSTSDFMSACFAATDKQLEVISTKLRAAAYENDANVEQAQAIRGRIVLVARDSDAAGDMQKDVAELVRDWQSQVENNEAKLVKLASQNTTSTREKVWAATIDTFVKALKKMQVTRSGRAVIIAYDEKFSADDVKEVQEALGKPDEKPEAVVAILAAIEKHQPVPASALGQLMGAKPAAFALDPGLSFDLTTFKTRWNAWLTATRKAKPGSLHLGDVTLSPKSGSTTESTFSISLFHHDDPAAEVTLSGVVGKDSEAIKQVTLSKTEGAKWAASAMDAVAFHGLVAAVSPSVDEKDLIQDLGMTPGTDTSAVRGRIRFAYTSTADGLTASYTAGPVSEAVGQCDMLLETVCSRYGSCFPAGRSAGFAQGCVSAGEAKADCGNAASVTSGYGPCISAVSKASCETLFPAGQPTLPATCDGVIKTAAPANPIPTESAPSESPASTKTTGGDEGSDAHRPTTPAPPAPAGAPSAAPTAPPPTRPKHHRH